MADTRLFSRLKRLFSTDVIIRNQGGNQLRVMDVNKIQQSGEYENNSLVDRFNRLYSTSPTSLYGYQSNFNYQTLRPQLYSEYDAMDNISKQKIREFTNEQAVAIQAFLQRQELNITDMEAFGIIEPSAIKVNPTFVNGGVVSTLGGPIVNAVTSETQNSNRIKFRVQISNQSNKLGIPEVGRQVKRTLVKFLRIFF